MEGVEKALLHILPQLQQAELMGFVAPNIQRAPGWGGLLYLLQKSFCIPLLVFNKVSLDQHFF